MLPPASRRHHYVVALSLFLLFSLLPLLLLSSQPSIAQGIPTGTPCYEMAFTGGFASTATPTSNNKTYLPCVATPTPGATLPADRNNNGTSSDTNSDASDGGGIVGAMSITTSVISDNYAVIAASDVSGVINAINTANQRISTLPAYPIYLDSGLYVFNNTSAPFPEIMGKVKIFGSGNTSIQVSPAAPIRFRDTANAELHNLYITNNRTATEMYSGSMIVNGTVSIYDSWIADSYAAFGAGGIRVGSIPGTATTLNLIRVYFLSNYAGGGAAMQVDSGAQVNGTCVQFDSNRGSYGRAILVGDVFGGGNVSLRYSSFYQSNSQHPQDVVNLHSTSSVVIEDSWWSEGSPHPVPSLDYSGNVTIDGVLSLDPHSTNPECFAQTPISYYDVAFTSDRSGNRDIWAMAPDGTNVRQITTNNGSDFYPVWSPDHTKLAFVSTRNGNTDIFVIDGSGSNEVQLTSDPASDYQPDWSPDSSALVFVSTRTGNPELFFILSNGTGLRQLTDNDAVDLDPVWRPFSEEIVFVSDREGIPRLYTIDTLTANEQPLIPISQLSGPAYSPVWSPNGTKLLFLSTAENIYDTWKIWTYTVQSSTVQPLTTGPGSDYEPAWSPDGNFVSFVSEQNPSVKSDIYIVSANGGTPVALGSSSSDDITPAWTFDGEDIVFVSDRTGNPDIFRLEDVIDANSQINTNINLTQLTSDAAPDYEPAGYKTIAEEQQYDLELAKYGIQLIEQGRRWSSPERQAILAGVQRVARAFNSVRTTADSNLYNSFRRVMNPTNTIDFIRTSTQNGDCLATVTSVTCRGNMARPNNSVQQPANVALTEFTIIHELGHIFDGRSNDAIRNFIASTTTSKSNSILDNVENVVMGSVVNSSGSIVWVRGERGWGSGPGSKYSPAHSVNGTPIEHLLTTYQRNTAPYPNQPNANLETAADMFLNWVFYVHTNGLLGFQDISWKPEDSCNGIPSGSFEGPGCPDATESGKARFDWIDAGIRQVFSQNSSW